MTGSCAFWIDRDYDRENASDGMSRFGAYVRQARFAPAAEGEDTRAALAIFAWTQATGPVMAPGYVREHQRIRRARLTASDWDGKSLLATVDVVMPQPGHLRWMRTDDERGTWQDWPRQRAFAGGKGAFYEPDADELAGNSYLLTTASIRFTVPSGELPYPDGRKLAVAADEAVTILVRELNSIVGPVLARIEESA
jgi:hypothetical protein